MKHSFLIILLLIAINGTSYSQNPIVDIYPRAQIFIIDPQSGQEIPATTDLAILYKIALIDLVRNTDSAAYVLSGRPPVENRVFIVTQAGVESNINGYRIALEQQSPDQSYNIYTFAFHVEDQTLYFYDPASRSWILERITENNRLNLRKASFYAQKFTYELANQQGSNQGTQLTADASYDINTPVDVNVAADTAPPVMPEYEQPECPNDGYLWQPGYWAYSPGRNDYYWVPGAWVAPPTPGVIWTPPYWGYDGGRYVFHIGYWGDHIGFYGGINYGYGYSGRGYYGGEWREGRFRYNTAVVRVNTTVVHNTYVNTTVINNTVINNHTSFNGRGGVAAEPTKTEIAANNEHHLNPTPEQNSNQLQARGNPKQFTKTNPGGKPVNLATTTIIVPVKGPDSNPGQQKGHPGLNAGQGGANPGKTGQGTNPANPGQQGSNPGKPLPLGANPGKPGLGTNPGTQGQGGANPGKSEKVTNPTNPGQQGSNPGKPLPQGANPGKPGLGANPGKPGQGTNPANPGQQGSNPGKPLPLKVNPGKPGLGANPGAQGQRTVNPAKPVQKANPGNPGLPGSNPAKPKKKVDTLPKPKVQPTTPPLQKQ